MLRTQLANLLRQIGRSDSLSTIPRHLSTLTLNLSNTTSTNHLRVITANGSTSRYFEPLKNNALALQPQRQFHLLKQFDSHALSKLFPTRDAPSLEVPKRTLIRYGYKGRRKTVKTVLSRFYRLDWGIWIRPRSGRHRKLYRKRADLVRWSRYHVFCSASQSTLFDKMVAKCWRTRKYYVDDPYESYHIRPEYHTTSRRGIRHPEEFRYE